LKVESELLDLPTQDQDVFVEDAVMFFSHQANRQKYPRLASAFDYWNTAREGKFAAIKIDFDISDLPFETIPYCMMVDVHSDGPEFIYRYWGTKCVDITKQEMTGKNVREVKPKAVSDENYNSYCVAYEKKAPLVFSKTHAKTFLLDSDDLFLRVPLTTNGVDCEFIFTVFEQPAHLLEEVEKKFEEAVKDNR